MDLPAKVLEELLKRHTIPEELSKLIYWLIVREVEENYPALNAHIKEQLIPYVTALDFVLSRLPRVSDKSKDSFSATVGELAGIGFEEVYSLRNISEQGFTLLNRVDIPSAYKEGSRWSRPHGLWKDLLDFRVSFDIPPRQRFEHTHVLATQGAGKTTLLKQLILKDLETNATVIVMTPKGDLIPSLERLEQIPKERLVIIRPDEKHPLALNVFDIKANTRDISIELISSIFSAGLDAATTWKQKPFLDNCIRLLLEVPEATIHTLYRLLKSQKLPDEYKKYLPNLSLVAQEFLWEQFHAKIYNETKEQIVSRLDALRNNDVVNSMFSSPKTLFNMGQEIEQGKVILIDTSEAMLGSYGSAFFGRFFITLVRLAFPQRDISQNLRPVWFYIDEAGSYLDDSAEAFFSRARESKVGLTVAHQYLSQLKKVSPNLETAVKSASIKFVGRCVAEDARDMASSMQLESSELLNQPPYTFKFKGLTPHAITVHTSADTMSSYKQRSDGELAYILEQNRKKYSAPPQPKKIYEPLTLTASTVPEKKHVPPTPSVDDDIESMNKI